MFLLVERQYGQRIGPNWYGQRHEYREWWLAIFAGRSCVSLRVRLFGRSIGSRILAKQEVANVGNGRRAKATPTFNRSRLTRKVVVPQGWSANDGYRGCRLFHVFGTPCLQRRREFAW